MADRESNAPLCADAGASLSGVIHVRTRLTAGFTVLSNALAQLPGSAVVVGVGAYIASLADGSRVSIDALCEHFDEGEILISRALRALEDAGYLERRRERQFDGRIRTRTYFYDVPGGDLDPDDPPEPPQPTPPRPRKAPRPQTAPANVQAAPTVTEAAPAALTTPAPAPAPPQPEAPAAAADIDPRILAVFTSLRRVDPRLELSRPEAARIAPGVGEWLAAGVDPVRIVSLLTEGLPDRFHGRPAGILAYRLRETPLPLLPSSAATAPPAQGDRPAAVHRLQNCDGCDRAFRAPEPGGRCRDCRQGEEHPAAAA
ncbi:helix-turn-helix transcriptional regulator [Streptomyces sp. NPDC047000]|uniref:helix-turn-helix transcriptional regulator n=1 Tax=Streptomyces sp. NPDC047000 TaxID=3155474 RepID=UPI0033C1931E